MLCLPYAGSFFCGPSFFLLLEWVQFFYLSGTPFFWRSKLFFWRGFNILLQKDKYFSLLFLFSKHRPSGPMLSINRLVRPCVCLFVCSLIEVPFKRLFAPLPKIGCPKFFCPPFPKVQCPNFLDFRNPWGKVMERNGLRFEYFAQKRSKISVAIFF